ncbi:YebC/PmpR family DNA-binding transcriptional regulator [Thermaerobacter subterraneus]|uniref:Probable transcriptional regulatory protein ThesuDRAFT_01686 n=1 Tax=Thermaerobacter subterraneus DSM 13965 TaxID=867903 RepID=K6PYZ4_9FIRM|nr:YebC/PmpR family DNA-binding transcriptional regulator [Thermaerobacter subterraneus]EKP93968.1 DNA-binding regulatory protein, YebC/PmpR family [Thermaerobacter subterraneus DSM 13965]
MAGHSKWANRKHRKARQDAKKGKIFSKLAREIITAVRQGGGDPEANPRLRLALERARQFSMPAENIERAIKRGLGESEAENYEELVYEGYGPGGVALMLEILTDNRNRSAGEIRHIFAKHGGNLGESGCVAWMFDRKGVITVSAQGAPAEDDLLLLAVEAGAEDLKAEDGSFVIYTDPDDLHRVREALEKAGVPVEDAGLRMVPKTEVKVEGKEAEQLLRLLDALEDHDDVQEIYGNFELPDELLVES